MKNLLLLTLITLSCFSCKDDSISKADLIGDWDILESNCPSIDVGNLVRFTDETMLIEGGSSITYELRDNIIVNTFLGSNSDVWEVTFTSDNLKLDNIPTGCQMILSK